MDFLDGRRESVEGNLGKQVVFALVLHATHQHQPEQTFVLVVSACLDLVINEGHFWILLESGLPLVVADQNNGWVEACDEFSDDEVDEIFLEDVEAGVVSEDEGQFDLDRGRGTMFMERRVATKESNLHFRYRNS